jgi:hypothetical protein
VRCVCVVLSVCWFGGGVVEVLWCCVMWGVGYIGFVWVCVCVWLCLYLGICVVWCV